MGILLINPPNIDESESKFQRENRPYPLSLLYLAAELEKGNFPANILDAVGLNLKREDALKMGASAQPGLCIVNIQENCLEENLGFAEELRTQVQAPVFLIGPYPTAFPKECLRGNELDGIISGWPQGRILPLTEALMDKRSIESVPGLVISDSGKLIFTVSVRKSPTFSGLITAKAYKEHINPFNYPDFDLPFPNITLLASLGGYGDYSSYFYPQLAFGGDHFTISPDSLAWEFAWVKENMKYIRGIRLLDNGEKIDEEWLDFFISQIQKNKAIIPWALNISRVFDEKLLNDLKKVGLFSIIYSFRRVSQDDKAFIQRAAKLKIKVNGAFFVDNANVKEMKKIYSQIVKMPFDSLRFLPHIRMDDTMTKKDFMAKNSHISLEKICTEATKRHSSRPQSKLKKVKKVLLYPQELIGISRASWNFMLSFAQRIEDEEKNRQELEEKA